MPNGFHGSLGTWEKMEAPFLQADPVLEKFAKAHAIGVSKNYHNWPERSLKWSSGKLNKLIQIYLKDEDRQTYCVWLCVSEVRGSKRYWKRQMFLEEVSWKKCMTTLSSISRRAAK
jgi:hypothetical protein